MSARGQHQASTVQISPGQIFINSLTEKPRQENHREGTTNLTDPKTSEPTGQKYNLATYILLNHYFNRLIWYFDLWSDIIDTDIWNTVNPIVTVAK